MHYGPQDAQDVMGIGSYVGEMRRGPDGQVYQWVEGVDGLGNPIGFWKGLRSLVSKALPIAKLIPGLGPIIGAVKPFCESLPQLQPVMQQAPGIQPVYQLGTKICKVLGKVGIADAEGEILEAPDGQLYEVVEGIGEPGRARPVRRRVWISIPAVVHGRHGHRRMGVRQVVTPAVPGAQPVVMAPSGPGVRPVMAVPAGTVRRFR